MHLAVEGNEYEALKMILEYPGEPKVEVGLKDALGRNPMDLASDLSYTNLKELLRINGCH